MMVSAILPPATLAMLGGGQLGRFFVAAAHEMGYAVWVLDPDPESPAGRIADRHLCAAYDDPDALAEIAARCAAATTEFENVPAATLAALAEKLPTRPSEKAVSICQNRIAEKCFLRDNGFPCGDFAVIETPDDFSALPDRLFPGILKAVRFGYDGKGQAPVEDAAVARSAFLAFGGEPCVLEQKLPLDCEISVVLARGENGQIRAFPVAENQHRNGILDISIVPARNRFAAEAQAIAGQIIETLNYVGVLAVEFFISSERILVNEMAPRPHNSGHYTLDACNVSQYEQQVRALCRLPLETPRLHSPAVMVNLLGDLWLSENDASREPDWEKLHAIPDLKLRLYGKRAARRGRKMGHFTVIGENQAATLESALRARRTIGIPD